MPGFNGSGTFVRTHSWITDRNNGVKIVADRHDAEDDAFATGLSSCIVKDGQTTTTARIPFAFGIGVADGSVGSPALNFTSDTDCGVYRIGANNIGVAVNGAKVLDVGTTGLIVTGRVRATAADGFYLGAIKTVYVDPSDNVVITDSEGNVGIEIGDSSQLASYYYNDEHRFLNKNGTIKWYMDNNELSPGVHATYKMGNPDKRITFIYCQDLDTDLITLSATGRINWGPTASLTISGSTISLNSGTLVLGPMTATTGTFSGALTYGGVTLSNAVTGTGNMVLSASPTLSGTVGGALTFSGTHTLSAALTYGGVTLNNAVTGTGNMVLSASPTFTGTIAAAAATLSGVLTYGGVALSAAVTGTGNMVLSAAPTLTGLTNAAELRVGPAGGIGTARVFRINDTSNSTSDFSAWIINTSATAGNGLIGMGVGPNSSDTTSYYFRFFDAGLNTAQGNIIRNGSGAVAFTTTSDIRGKPNRERLPLERARLVVDGLTIWDFDKEGNAIRGVGVIAQEAIKVLPSMVHVPADGSWMSVEKAGPVPYLVANMQQANARLDHLAQELTAARSEIERLVQGRR